MRVVMDVQHIRAAIDAMERERVRLDLKRDKLAMGIATLTALVADESPTVGGPSRKRAVAPVLANLARVKPGRGGGGVMRPTPAPKPLGSRVGARVIDRTVDVLTKAGKPMHVDALAKAIGHPRKSLQQTLASYVKRGTLAHTGRAEFGLPQTAAAVVKRPADAELSGGVEPRFSALHLPEPYRGGYRCSRCREYHEQPEQFEGYCQGVYRSAEARA